MKNSTGIVSVVKKWLLNSEKKFKIKDANYKQQKKVQLRKQEITKIYKKSVKRSKIYLKLKQKVKVQNFKTWKFL